jgi:hypothetical protein
MKRNSNQLNITKFWNRTRNNQNNLVAQQGSVWIDLFENNLEELIKNNL